MAYKPPMIKTGSGPTGVAKVQIKQGKVRVEFKNKEIAKSAIIMKQSECPDNLFPGVHFVNLDAGKTKIRSFRPVNGMYRAKVQSFVSQKDKDPTPQTYVGKDYSYQYFTVLFEIVQGDYEGCIVPNNYRYHFDIQEQTIKHKGKEIEAEVIGFTSLRSKYTPMLIEFCDATGVWNKGPIKGSDNCLPDLEKRILQEDKLVDLALKDGYVVTLYATDEGAQSEPDEAEEVSDAEDAGEELTWD